MEKIPGADLHDACTRLETQRLPRWQDLPDLDLYMDQVLELTARYMESWSPSDGKGLTAAMINNYVTAGALPKPVKKRYSRRHIARLLVICVLKSSLPIPVIRALLSEEMPDGSEETFYTAFCRTFEQTCAEAARHAENEQETLSPAVSAALRARAEQALALRLAYEAYPGKQGQKECRDIKRTDHGLGRGA